MVRLVDMKCLCVHILQGVELSFCRLIASNVLKCGLLLLDISHWRSSWQWFFMLHYMFRNFSIKPVFSNDMTLKKSVKFEACTHETHLRGCWSTFNLLNKRGSQFSIVPRLWAGHPRQHNLIPGSKRYFSFPGHPEWFWSLPSFLFTGCWGHFIPGNKTVEPWSWLLTSI